MPVASSSRGARRTHRRDPSSDAIEEDPSQMAVDEEVDNEAYEDNQPRRKLKGVKRERAATAVPQGEDDEQEQEDPLKDFGDQPLDRGQLTKLGGMATDWGMIRRQTHVLHYQLVRDVAAAMAEFSDGEKGSKGLVEIDEVMRNLIDTENGLISHEEALHDIHQKLARGEAITDVIDRYKANYSRLDDEYKKKTTRQKYGKNDEYAKYRQAVFEVQYPDTAMPPVTDFLPKEDGDDSDEDDDVQVGGVTQDYKCPITLTILVDPLTSEVCGHSFSASAIRDYFHGKPSVKCPASGCNKAITLDILKPNNDLARQAKEAARRERMRDDDDNSDDEDVVE